MTPFAVGGPYQVQLTINFPDITTIYRNGNLGVATIGPSVEHPVVYYGGLSVNLKLRKMIITLLADFNWGGSYPQFNGPVVTSLTSGAYLPQPTFFISYTAANLGILTSNATTKFSTSLNWAGINFHQGDTIVIGW
jgi:hypothetical protein